MGSCCSVDTVERIKNHLPDDYSVLDYERDLNTSSNICTFLCCYSDYEVREKKSESKEAFIKTVSKELKPDKHSNLIRYLVGINTYNYLSQEQITSDLILYAQQNLKPAKFESFMRRFGINNKTLHSLLGANANVFPLIHYVRLKPNVIVKVSDPEWQFWLTLMGKIDNKVDWTKLDDNHVMTALKECSDNVIEQVLEQISSLRLDQDSISMLKNRDLTCQTKRAIARKAKINVFNILTTLTHNEYFDIVSNDENCSVKGIDILKKISDLNINNIGTFLSNPDIMLNKQIFEIVRDYFDTGITLMKKYKRLNSLDQDGQNIAFYMVNSDLQSHSYLGWQRFVTNRVEDLTILYDLDVNFLQRNKEGRSVYDAIQTGIYDDDDFCPGFLRTEARVLRPIQDIVIRIMNAQRSEMHNS